MVILTPHRKVSLQRAQLVHKDTLVMLGKTNLFHPFLATVTTEATETQLALLLVSF